MKRRLLFVAALLVIMAVQVSAQVRVGVTGGVGWNKSRISDIVEDKAPAGWNAGLTLSCKLPLGFSVQPTLQYHQKAGLLTKGLVQKMSYLELPVSVQWGPDLLVFRPFLDCTPYVGYALGNRTYSEAGIATSSYEDNSWQGKQRFEYGLGLGGGIEVWRLQIVARYNWNFGSLYNLEEWDGVKDIFTSLKPEGRNFGGVTLGVSFFF